MLPDSPSPRAALALSDLQTQTGASTFAVGTDLVTGGYCWLDHAPRTHQVFVLPGSLNWHHNYLKRWLTTSWPNIRTVIANIAYDVERSLKFKSRYDEYDERITTSLPSQHTVLAVLAATRSWIKTATEEDFLIITDKMFFHLLVHVITLSTFIQSEVNLPACHNIPKVLCCTERVLDKCLTGCIDYVTEKCPHKLEKFDAIQDEKLFSDNKVDAQLTRGSRASTVTIPRTTPLPRADVEWMDNSERRRAPTGSDRKLLNQEYPITEVSDADLTIECGVEKSRPPYSPCLARKVVDDVFKSCCHQHVPEACHQLCTYEHREHVAAETLIAAVQQGGCDLKYLAPILYCANQNRDNRKCCGFLGMASSELGVGDRCLRMCNVAPSGDRVGVLEKSDLVCLSNWNVIMYCARSGLRTFN